MRRIDRILDRIQTGEYNAEMIRQSIKAEDVARGHENNRRGRESEANTRRILGSLKYVREARQHVSGSPGRDIKVIFKSGLNLAPLFVEVKSSLDGVEEFQRSPRYANLRRNQVRLVVLNGSIQRLDEDIVADFERQLARLDPAFTKLSTSYLLF